MLQYKRIFMFIPLSILLPALSVAILVLVFSRFGIATTAFSFLATSYIVGGALTFVVFWWFATGVNKKPYLHAFVMYEREVPQVVYEERIVEVPQIVTVDKAPHLSALALTCTRLCYVENDEEMGKG